MRYVVTETHYPEKLGQPTYLSIRDQKTRLPDIPSSAYLIYLRNQKGSSRTTQRNYADTISHLLNAVAASSVICGDWRKLEPQHLASYHRLRARELADSSLDVMVSRLRTFFGWAYESGWLNFPTPYSWRLPHEEEANLKVMRADQRSRDPFNLWGQYIPETEFKYFLTFNPRKSSYERIRDEIILKLGYYSGLRRSEIVHPDNFNLSRVRKAIKTSDDHGGFELKIIGKGSHGGKVRTIYVTPEVTRQITSFIANELKRQTPDATLLIGKRKEKNTEPLNVNHATNLFTEIADQMLINGDAAKTQVWRSKVASRSFHSLRHSYATNFGGEVNLGRQEKELLMERMGHAFSETTEIYLWFSAKKAGDKEVADRYASSLQVRRIRTFEESSHEL